MKCEKCGAPEVAVKAVIQDQNGAVKNINLCSKCFQEISNNKFELGNIDLSMVDKLMKDTFDKISSKSKECSSCNTTINDFKKFKLVGCPQCYSTFKSEIDEEIYKISGITPGYMDGGSHKKYIEQLLKQRLETAIDGEEFELASKIKKEIEEISES